MSSIIEANESALRHEIVNRIVGAIVHFLNKGKTENFEQEPESYGAVLTLAPTVKTLYFTYRQYGTFRYSLDGNQVKRILPEEMKCLVDCIRNLGIDF